MNLSAGPRYGSPQEIATFTGLSTRTVRRLYSKRKLPAHKIERRVMISFEDAESLIRRSSRQVPDPQAIIPSSLTPEGRAIAYSTSESRMRVRIALEALDHLDAEDLDDEVEQAATLAELRRSLQTNRGDS